MASSQDGIRISLRTAEQYHLWKARVHAACWAATRLDVFTITNEVCDTLAASPSTSEEKDKPRPASESPKVKDPVGKCWTLITGSLHDDLFIKLVHVQSGHIASLMAEIRSALLVNIAEDAQPLRLELYGASMQKDCNNDLQSFIAYIIQRRDKLLFLKIKIPEEELCQLFLKGLPSIFQPLQLHYAIPGNSPATFDALIATTRRFASTPIVTAELAKLKSSGLSQNIFTTISRPSPQQAKEQRYCYRFAKNGSCTFGDKCRFYHSTSSPPVPTPPKAASTPARQCSYCHFKGHTIEECRKRAKNNKTTLVSISDEKEEPLSLRHEEEETQTDESFVFVFTVGSLNSKPKGWIFDSGATRSATFDASDCIGIKDCDIMVTAAGCSFKVKQIGTAIIPVADDSGVTQTIQVRNCLISEKFPVKLLALQSFAKRGNSVVMKDKTIHISNPSKNFVIVAHKDPGSKLFFLQEKTGDSLLRMGQNVVSKPERSLLAKSYSALGGDTLWKLHLRHGHRNFDDICRQYGIPAPKIKPVCTSCVMGKAHLHPHISSGFVRASRPAEGFHSDFRGPFSTPTPFGHVYLLTIIDDFSRRIFPFLVKSQTEWYDIWPKFVTRVEAEFGKANCISWLLSDNGGVYISHAMKSFCEQKGIQQRHSAPYAQFMDHTSERNMRTIGEMMTTTMLHANLPRKTWGWASLHAAEVLNRTTESILSNKAAGAPSNASRLERWKGKPMPSQTNGLYPFGCLAFKCVPLSLRNKLDAHATPCVYLGMDASTRAYLLGSLFDLATSVSVEVTFFEHVFPFRRVKQEGSGASLLWNPDSIFNAHDPRLGAFDTKAGDQSNISSLLDSKDSSFVLPAPLSQSDPVISSITDTQNPVMESRGDEKMVAPPSSDSITPPGKPQDIWRQALLGNKAPAISQPEPTVEIQSVPTKPVELRRSNRIKELAPNTTKPLLLALSQPPTDGDSSFDRDFSFVSISEASLESITPRTARQALSSSLADKWLHAMNKEKKCHLKNKTFDTKLTPPVGAKIIPADWVLRIKYRGGPIEVDSIPESLFKARVVIRGQFMQEGLQFNDTFAPVAKPTTLRALLAIAAKHKCLLMSGDVETAFLSAKMDCEVWIKLPPFWGKDDEMITNKDATLPPCLLLKGVPGIPQGSRLFYETFAAHLLRLGYVPTLADKCLFINSNLKERNAVLVWVDDFIYLCENEETYRNFISAIRSAFNVPSCGPLKTFLGITIERNVELCSLKLCQRNSVLVLLERARMLDCNPAPTPCVTGAVFTKKDCPEAASPNDFLSDFRSLIAMANFISCWSRPDITFTVNKLCKFMSNPGEVHWRQLKHLIRYLAGTIDWGIQYDFDKTTTSKFNRLHGYSDSSFADCPDTSRSTLAYAFFLDNAIISWYSKLNTYVTTCTNHSEYNALALAAREAEWLLLLFKQLLPEEQHTPIPILVDNSGVVSMVFNPVEHQSNKHVKISCHYTRELVSEKIIIPQRVPSESNLADLFTKPLNASVFNKLASSIISPPTQEATIMMLKADLPEDPNDQDITVHTGFRQDWPYVAKMKETLGATSFLVSDNGTFSTGRKKLLITFVRLDDAGVNNVISRHDAMQLLSKAGNMYMVCKRTPLLSQETPHATPTMEQDHSLPEFAESFSNISLKSPQPALVCNTCGFHNTIQMSLLQCTSCSGSKFDWSCACTSHPETKAPPSRAPIKPKRDLSNLKSWVSKIKYEAPIRRGSIYHQLSCTAAPQATSLGTTEFASAMKLLPAPCCN
jgi:hypothetical protein